MRDPSFLRVSLEGLRHHLILTRRITTMRDTAQNAETADHHDHSAQKKYDLLKSQFLAIMSHELRTPLTVICGHLSLLTDGVRGDLSDEVRYGLTKAMEASGHLVRLVNNLLDLTWLSAGSMEIRRGPADLGALLEELARQWSGAIKDRSVVLLKEISPLVPQIETDEKHLKKILDNLLDNAIKFTREGKIVLGARSREDAVEVWVADTGIGISREAREFIFDAFRQVDASDTRSYQGMGLGLALSKKLVRLLGGRIEVESETGRGSTFRVILPRGSPYADKDFGC
ncbi:MAG: HAMP domain-containing histidine kinase [Deltaproteobacteria bacterium]|nr:HAMP domain-containing histidine kinase [Deltaproteobacteria bacterium]